MFNKICLTLLIVIILLITNISMAIAEISPIWPLETNLIGLDYKYNIKSFSPYIGMAIGLDTGDIYKHLGTTITFEKVKFDINYGFWLNQGIPGYIDQTGIEGTMFYAFSPDQNIMISLFDGEVSSEEKEQTSVDSIFIRYDQPLFNIHGWQLNIYSEITAGLAEQTEDAFFAHKLILPLKYNNFKIIPTFGTINQDDVIKPYYDLADFVRGYPEKNITGDQAVALTVEQQYPLFLYSENPYLSSLQGVIFIDGGKVFKSNENTKDIDIHSSVGAGLVLYLVKVDMGLVEAVTDEGDWGTLFYCKLTF